MTIPGSVTSIGDSAFSDCFQLTSVTIPSSVTAIGDSAFYRCSSLTSVTIPGSVTGIGDSAFAGCSGLTNATMGGNAPGVGQYAFDSTPATVYYQPGTTGWGSSFGGIPTAVWQRPTPVILPPPAIGTNGFGFTLSWATNATVVVEAADALASSGWSAISTNTIRYVPNGTNAFNGWLQFNDSQWTNSRSRFYRVSGR